MQPELTTTHSAPDDAEICRRIMNDVGPQMDIIPLLKHRNYNDIVTSRRVGEALDVVANVHNWSTGTVLLDVIRAKKSMMSGDGFDAYLVLIEYVENDYDAIIAYEEAIRIDYDDARAELEDLAAA